MKRLFHLLLSWPLAVPVALWAWWHERRILREGRELSTEECELARRVGVKCPQEIRVLAVPRVPNPLMPFERVIERFTRYNVFSPAGMTLGVGVYVLEALQSDRQLLAHEFVHIGQYERFGGYGFMRRYIFQCLSCGYLEAPMELEARVNGERACGEE